MANVKQSKKNHVCREGKVNLVTFICLSVQALKTEELHTLLRMISGARYSGVPHNVQVLPFTRLANPKSVTYKSGVHAGGKVWTYETEQQYAYIFCVAAHLNVAVVVNEKILRLQISVYEI